jgi:NAD(P)-dependent dehydrogenase (short-subunit alcohol dehydrogenase family)
VTALVSGPPEEGLRALVSGAAGDIGHAICLALSARGVEVTGVDTRPSAECRLGDTTDQSSMRELVAEIRPAVVVVNAAIVRPGPVLAQSMDDWEDQIKVNLTGAYVLAREAMIHMEVSGTQGRILFIGSWAAERPDKGITAYCASKAGMRMLMKCLAAEGTDHGICVNELALGYVDAGLSGAMFAADPVLRARCVERVPSHRLITAAEAGEEAARICLDVSDHVTGSVFLMDGGLSL